MSLHDLLAALPEPARKYGDPASPLPMRMMAAKGMAPLAPLEMAVVLCALSLDADDKIKDFARASLANLPDKILLAAMEGSLPPAALAMFGPMWGGRPALLEKLVLHPATPDDTVAEVALTAPAEVAQIIAGNQERCLRSEAIVRAVAKNPNAVRSHLDALFDFLVRAGAIQGDMPEFADAMARLQPADVEKVTSAVALPAEVATLLEDTSEAEARAKEVEGALDGHAHDARERIPLLKLLTRLNVAQRVALALRGNREARALLVRDPSRVVATAAIRNPRLTEQEVQNAAQSRSVSEDVVRVIAGSKELSRPYGVKLALVGNPKTPMPSAMRMLALLREADVRSIAKSKNVSQAIANQAKRLLAQKGGVKG